jgi:glycine cleavage system H protein
MLAADDDMKRQVPFGELEGHQETRQLYPPVETRILEVNEELLWDQAKLEKDPYGDGWLMRIALPEGPALLHMMTSTAYTEFCERDLEEDSADE